MSYLADDENVKAMRETARAIGLTQLLIAILTSNAQMGFGDLRKLIKALELLGVNAEDWQSHA